MGRRQVVAEVVEPRALAFDAYELARAWLAVAIAQGSNDNQPELCRTTLVEWYPHGVRLVSTDSFVMLRGWVPADGQEEAYEPRLWSLPYRVTVVRDTDKRAVGLFTYLRAATKGQTEGKAEPITVVLSVDRPQDEVQPTLTPDLAAEKLTIDVPGSERLRLDTFDGTFPDWRPPFDTHSPAPVDGIGVTTLAVLRLGALAKLYGGAMLRWTFAGPRGAIFIQVELAGVTVCGLAMPATAKEVDAAADAMYDDVGRLVDLDTGEVLEVAADPAGEAEATGKRTRRKKEAAE